MIRPSEIARMIELSSRAGIARLLFVDGQAPAVIVRFAEPFPEGRVLSVTATALGTDARTVLAVSNVTPTGFTLRGTFPAALTGPVSVCWQALPLT